MLSNLQLPNPKQFHKSPSLALPPSLGRLQTGKPHMHTNRYGSGRKSISRIPTVTGPLNDGRNKPLIKATKPNWQSFARVRPVTVVARKFALD